MIRQFVVATVVGFICLSGVTTSLQAGQFNETRNIGDQAPAWKDLPGTDGKKHSLDDLKDKKVVVVVFTCISCPTATDYEDRIQALAKQYAGSKGDAAVVAICVNKVEEDRLPKLQERAKKKGFVFPYLYDESQKIAKEYGAIFTPEFFVLNAERKIVYMGAMDDSTEPEQVKVKHVEAAIQATLKGTKPAVTETVARGCMVRYARERRKSR